MPHRRRTSGNFRVLQDNAEKFQHNKELTEGRQRRLQQVGAFRAPTNAFRSFQPSSVRATDGTETLLKHALAVKKRRASPAANTARDAIGSAPAARLQPAT